jgi:5-methylcytosine-specific restriction endonuclease McrA
MGAKAKVINKLCDSEGCLNLARSNGAAYCETHYYRLRRTGSLDVSRPPVYYLSCQHCGKPSNGNKNCSIRCATRASRGSAVSRPCVSCGIDFQPVQNKLTCSSECDRIRKQSGWDERRCLASSTIEGRSIRYEVFRRDNWTCKICNEPVNRNSKWPDHDYPTLDHIHPFSKGGRHTMDNLQCAHFICNTRKHAKVLNAPNVCELHRKHP